TTVYLHVSLRRHFSALSLPSYSAHGDLPSFPTHALPISPEVSMLPSSAHRPISFPNTCGPSNRAINPAIMEDGKNRFCIHVTFTLSHLPINIKTPKYNRANPI